MVICDFASWFRCFCSTVEDMDWDDVRVFLAVERAGSVNAAAHTLRIDASTVGRRLARLEQSIGASLFERSAAGTALTAAGERVLPEAERLEESAVAVVSAGSEELAEVEGTVRLATAEPLFIAFLRPHLSRLRAAHPALSLEMVTATASVNLLKREADVALRPATRRPPQKKVVVKKVSAIAYSLYASEAYLEARGRPATGAAAHDVVGFDPQFGSTPQTVWADRHLAEARVAFTANSMLSRAEACAAGWGLAALPCFLARRHPELVSLDPDVPSTSLWILVHPELRRSARVRAVVDFLTETVRAHRGQLESHDA